MLTRDTVLEFVQRRVLVVGPWGEREVQVNGVTDTHLIAFWPYAFERIEVPLQRLESITPVEHVCPSCARTVPVLHGEVGICTDCYRAWARAQPPRPQPCDDCGNTGNVWRDPITKRNEYFCATCHGKRGKVFLNRWAPSTWQGAAYTDLECLGRNVRGTKDCRGSVLLRGPKKIPLCNAHAGKYHREGG